MRALMWFRSDLRTSDNPALHAATRRATRGVVAVCTICPDQWVEHDMSAVKVDFVLRNLAQLSADLAAKNVAVQIVETPSFDEVPAVLDGLARSHECDALFFNHEYEVNERRRDRAVATLFNEAGRNVHTFVDQGLFEPGSIRTRTGNFYTVFTPFKKAWYKAFDAERGHGRPLGAAKKQAEMVGMPDAVPTTVGGFDSNAARPDLWPAGEKAGREKLGVFVRQRLEAYKDDRDHPAINGTSVLSPYLVSGVVSLRQCVHTALDANDDRLDTGSDGAVQWISELIWREFYKHILVGFPRVSMHRAFKRATEGITWNENDEHFAAWCEGRTGYPIVDAAMRQLVQTGWMHNRLRMVVAMFLSKNLFLDWRRGERFFMRHLVDGDLSANNGGWQWASSTGTDAAPYFRIFNPYSQSKRFDADGAFIRRFVPELAGVEGPAIHDPSSLPPLLRAGVAYPDPIVDHATTRAYAIDAFKRAMA